MSRTWRTPMPRNHVASEVCTLAPTSPIPGAWAVTLDRH